MVTSSYGGALPKRTVAPDDEVFQPPVAGSEALVVLWPTDFEKHVDDAQIQAVRDLPVEATSSASGKTGESSVCSDCCVVHL